MRKQKPGAALQITQIINTIPGKGRKPKLWGFHKSHNAAPGVCIVTDARGRMLQVVK